MSNGDRHLTPNDFSSSFQQSDSKPINELYQIKEEFDNEGNWKGYRIGVIDHKRPLQQIKPYDVPIKYDENKGLDNYKSNNGLQ
jgi:hypothetical protein